MPASRFTNIINSRADFTLINTFRNFDEVGVAFAKQRPEILVVDYGLPGENGISGLRLIHSKWPQVNLKIF